MTTARMAKPRARSAAARAPRVPLPWPLLGLFAISGAAALVFEIAWTRDLVLALGASSRATALVLAVFMGGLGLGSWLAGRIADVRAARALVLFSIAEALIGAYGLLSIPLLGRVLPSLAGTLAHVSGGASLGLAGRALLAVAALLPPTILMGATLPLIARWATANRIVAARGTGAFYAANTLGAFAGALLAPFALVPALGLSGAIALASAGDLVVAGGVYLWARGRAAIEELRPESTAPEAPADTRAFALALAAYAGSGFAGLVLEVTSARTLAMLAGSSVYAFGIMLAAFLLGIALGSLAAAPFAAKAASPARGLGLALGGVALGAAFAQRLFASGGYAALGKWAAGVSSWSYAFELGGALLTLLPVALALGAAVPFVARLAEHAPARFGRRFGLAYALNTGGAVAGALLAGLVLIPLGGTAVAAWVAIGVAGVLGIAVAAGSGVRPYGPLALTALAIALAWGADPVGSAIAAQLRGRAPLAFREGPVETLAVVDEDNDQQLRFLRMITNRTSLTGTHLYAQRYMGLLAHLPALWGPEPKRALVICFGTGMTAAAAATYPSLTTLDIAEIAPEVIDVAPLFEPVNGRVLADPRTRLSVEDGRHVILASKEPWDYITLEPPPPRDAGVVSLYSTGFYTLAKQHLTPGGVVAQWIPLHSQSLAEVKMLVRSFADSFPHAIGLLPVERDLLLLGSDRPLAPNVAELARRMAAPAVRASLARIGIDEPADLLGAVTADRETLLRFAGDAPLVTDDNPAVEYFARYGKRPALPDPAGLVAPPPLSTLVTGGADPALAARVDRVRAALDAMRRSAYAFERRDGASGERLAAEALKLRPHDPYLAWTASLSDEHVRRLLARAQAGDRSAALAQRLARVVELAPDRPEVPAIRALLGR